METGLIENLVESVQLHPGWLIALAFGFAFLESLAIIGIFVPGIILLFLVGALIGPEGSLFLACWLAASGGALTGDIVSYHIGHRFRHRIGDLRLLRKHPHILASGQSAVVRHGGKGVLIGRFIGPLRPVVPMVAGMAGMPLKLFLIFAIPACVFWAPAYLLPGMLFGASLELAAEFAGRLVILLLVVVGGVWFVVWLTRLVYNFTARRSGWWLKSLIRWSSEHSLVGRVVGPLFVPGKRELLSVTLLGMLLLVSLALLLGVLVAAPLGSGPWDAERQVAGWAASLRNHFADPVFVALALVADLGAMGVLAAVVALLLLAFRRANAAWHWAAATAGAWVLAEILAGVMGLMIEAPAQAPGLGEVPHRGLTLATTVLGFFAVMVAKDLSASRRKWPYLAGTVVLTLVAFALFYLGRASISGLLSALALGGGWSALVGIGYRQRAIQRRHPGVLAASFYSLLIAVSVVNIDANYDYVHEASRLAQPSRLVPAQTWAEHGWQRLPSHRSRLGRGNRQVFDFQIAADLHDVELELAAAGWRHPPAPENWLIAAVGSRNGSSAMAHVPRDFAGRPENLVMVTPLTDDRMAVARFWSSGAQLSGEGEPVWLGQVRIVRPGRFLGIFNHWREVPEQRSRARDRLRTALGQWEVREVSEAVWLFNGSG